VCNVYKVILVYDSDQSASGFHRGFGRSACWIDSQYFFSDFFAKNGQKQLSLEEVRDMLDVDDDEDLDGDDYGHESDFESEY
jgi:hypothetical protein